jgi:hypothetical protein
MGETGRARRAHRKQRRGVRRRASIVGRRRGLWAMAECSAGGEVVERVGRAASKLSEFLSPSRTPP